MHAFMHRTIFLEVSFTKTLKKILTKSFRFKSMTSNQEHFKICKNLQLAIFRCQQHLLVETSCKIWQITFFANPTLINSVQLRKFFILQCKNICYVSLSWFYTVIISRQGSVICALSHIKILSVKLKNFVSLFQIYSLSPVL